MVANGRPQYITSPLFDRLPYQEGQECVWRIKVKYLLLSIIYIAINRPTIKADCDLIRETSTESYNCQD